MILIFYQNRCVYVVDGGWSSWVCGPCSKTCGSGTQSCTRSCNNPTVLCGGRQCIGSSVITRSCPSVCCPGKIVTSPSYMCNILWLEATLKLMHSHLNILKPR